MARSSAQQIVLYDDSCPLCTFQMRALTWLDWRGVISLKPLSSPASQALAPQLRPGELRAEIHCLAPDGRIHRGARAIRHLALRIPALVPLAVLLWIPGVIWIATRVYALVSRNRHLLSRWFGCEEACAYLPARNQEVELNVNADAETPRRA